MRRRSGRRALRSRWPRACSCAAILLLLLGACSEDDDGAAPGSAAPEDVAATQPAGEDVEPVEEREYRTRPDLTPPVIQVSVSSSTTGGWLFLAPKQAEAQTGPLIVDSAGELVWSSPAGARDSAADFRVQTYQGQPVLTWWEGVSHRGWGEGDFVIADASYTEIARFPAGNGREGDLHELQLTEDGTALVLVYEREERDLSSVDGPADGWQFENYVQEIDVATGEVLLEWAASEHVEMEETYGELSAGEGGSGDGSEQDPYDWFHVNSAALWDEDTIVISARNTHAVYGIHRTTGELEWRLGGRRSDFEMGEAASFAWQHDARRQPDGTLSLFDNQANADDEPDSRALFLRLDEEAMTAEVVSEQPHPDGVRSRTQGNTQRLADGGLVVGWGNQGRVSQFLADGTLVYDATWAPADSYRVYRMPWVGRPTTSPDVVVDPGAPGQATVHISWNGATEVASWRVLGGADASTLTELMTVPKDGFETSAAVASHPVLVVEALDATGQVLGRSDPVAP